jgi:hypothetical protein
MPPLDLKNIHINNAVILCHVGVFAGWFTFFCANLGWKFSILLVCCDLVRAIKIGDPIAPREYSYGDYAWVIGGVLLCGYALTTWSLLFSSLWLSARTIEQCTFFQRNISFVTYQLAFACFCACAGAFWFVCSRWELTIHGWSHVHTLIRLGLCRFVLDQSAARRDSRTDNDGSTDDDDCPDDWDDDGQDIITQEYVDFRDMVLAEHSERHMGGRPVAVQEDQVTPVAVPPPSVDTSLESHPPAPAAAVAQRARRARNKTRTCGFCGAHGARSKCAGCGDVYYCSQECQRSHYMSETDPHRAHCRQARDRRDVEKLD